MLACVSPAPDPEVRTLGEPFPRSPPDGEGGSGHLKAIRFVGAHRPAEILDVPGPRPGPGEVVDAVAAAGLCRPLAAAVSTKATSRLPVDLCSTPRP
jgi:hypothetical protein